MKYISSSTQTKQSPLVSSHTSPHPDHPQHPYIPMPVCPPKANRNSIVKLYPNPTSGILNVDFRGAQVDEVVINNLLGQKILQENPKSECPFEQGSRDWEKYK